MIKEEALRLFVPNENQITSEGRVIFIEKIIKRSGKIWIFHKNDHDPFPSVPHGHNKETGEKLDVNTGFIYSKSKKITRKLKEKQMIYIYRVLKDNGFFQANT